MMDGEICISPSAGSSILFMSHLTPRLGEAPTHQGRLIVHITNYTNSVFIYLYISLQPFLRFCRRLI